MSLRIFGYGSLETQAYITHVNQYSHINSINKGITMDNKKFERLMKQVERKDAKDNEKSTAKAEELRRLMQTACSQLLEIYEYVKHDLRFKYGNVHYTVTLDRIDFETAPDKIHINRCVDGTFVERDIDMIEITDDAGRNLDLMNEVITNWFKAKGV